MICVVLIVFLYFLNSHLLLLTVGTQLWRTQVLPEMRTCAKLSTHKDLKRDLDLCSKDLRPSHALKTLFGLVPLIFEL